MGTLRGHVFPGLAFFIVGLWNLFNQTKMYATKPRSYRSSMWFPTKRFRYLELCFIMFGACTSISMELFIGPAKHQPLDPDGTIPKTHLHNFEHSTISLGILVYAILAMRLDKLEVKSDDHDHNDILHFVATIGFGQEFLLFHLHSTDHKGLEWHYHLLLQVVIFVSLFSTFMGAFLPRNFLIHFVRCLSVVFQGVWFNVVGFMLYTPSLMPRGCFIETEEAHLVVKCPHPEDLYRAKSLVNLEFCWYLTGTTILAACFYVSIIVYYGRNVEYSALSKNFEEEEEECIDHCFGLKDEDGSTDSPKENNFGKFNGGVIVAFDVEKRWL